MTHLVQLLEAADPQPAGIDRVTVWGGRHLLDQLPTRPWLSAVHQPTLDGNALARFDWQQRRLTSRAAAAADLLFTPGGTYLGRFRPFVTMFRNMLPFDRAERARYGMSAMRVKLSLLHAAQTATFRRADGVIALTEYAVRVLRRTVRLRGRDAVIPHGIDDRFLDPPRAQVPIEAFSSANPFRWLYVTSIHPYKHPWNVAEAVASLRAAGFPVALEIVGPSYGPSGDRLARTIDRLDPRREFITVTPAMPHRDLPGIYGAANAFVFASTCENMPNTLLEAMASGLPIACSNRPPMPDVLADGGVYFDAEDSVSIADALKRLLADPALRTAAATIAWHRARQYSWRRCAHETFEFLRDTTLAASRRFHHSLDSVGQSA